MKTSESISNIATKLAAFRTKVIQPTKDADNPFFKSKYVPLENVQQSIDEALPEGLTYVQEVTSDGQNVAVSTIVLDASGEYIQFEPFSMKAKKDTPQDMGSVETYARRYSLSAVFGITSDPDDDGNLASGQGTKKPTPKPSNNRKSNDPLADDSIRSEITSEIKTLSLVNGQSDKENSKRIMLLLGIPTWKELTMPQAEAMKKQINKEAAQTMKDDMDNLEAAE